MSDAPQGPGWWQASDGRWYPPATSLPPPPGYPVRRTAGGATASLVFGILSFVICPIVGPILALIFGYQARREIRESNGALEGGGMATAGIVLGYVGLVVPALVVVLALVVALIGTNANTKFSVIPNSLSMLSAFL